MTTFVLIHGANQGGWIWQPTATRLRAAGHLVHAPSLDGCGERRHSLRPGITTATHATELEQVRTDAARERDELRAALESRAQVLEESRGELRGRAERAERDLDAARAELARIRQHG